ncbi:MAG: T9SS type A sorting domain-containing protein [Bacteroidales bacterium]|nr:T9SS type A sorting domain-containing protein [Bacteroidales bacterium]
MKTKIILLCLLLLGLTNFAQNNTNVPNSEGNNRQTKESLNNAQPASPSLTITGETDCCYNQPPYNNTYDYTIHISGSNVTVQKFDVTVTDGTVLLIDGVNPSTGWTHTGDKWSTNQNNPTHTFRINWDDENGMGKIHAYVEFYQVIPMGAHRNADKHIFIGPPVELTTLNFSNSHPYVGTPITCSTNPTEGAQNYIWKANNTTFHQGPETTVTYTPTSSGQKSIMVIAENECGQVFKYGYIFVNPIPPSPFEAVISGPSSGNNSGTYTWVATLSNGEPNYNYHWYYSYDGVNYNYTWATTLNTSSETDSHTLNLPENFDLYLKLVATDGSNDQAIAFFFTRNTDAGGHPLNMQGTNDQDNTLLKDSKQIQVTDINSSRTDFLPYPNPVCENIILPEDALNKYKTFSLKSLDGKVVYEGKLTDIKINIASQSNGLYILVLNNPESNTVKYFKIVKQ